MSKQNSVRAEYHHANLWKNRCMKSKDNCNFFFIFFLGIYQVGHKAMVTAL